MVAKPLQRLVLALLALVVIGGSSPSQAQSSSSKVKSLQAKKKTNKAAIKDIESQLRETKQQQRTASARLYAAQRKLASAEDELAATRAKLRAAKDRLEASREELARVEAELKKAIDLFWERMAIFYKQGSLGYVEVALGAADFEQFVDRGILLKKIAEHDLELREQIELERTRREVLVATVTANVTELEGLRQSEADRAAELRSVRDEHQSALDSILAQRAEQDGIYTELRETQREISRTLSRLLNPPSANGVRSYGGNPNFAGGFARPVNGRVTSSFGWRRHPILGTRRFHNGVDFAAPSGTTIRAAAAGTVVSAGWMRAYGKTVMVNHGNGYVSMYAHCSSLLVSNGASVSQGQAIARVGSTGLSTGPHLHFTIYRNGTEVNPLR